MFQPILFISTLFSFFLWFPPPRSGITGKEGIRKLGRRSGGGGGRSSSIEGGGGRIRDGG